MTYTEFEDDIREKVRSMALDRFSYREIADKLATEQGYDRALVVRVIHNLKEDRRILPEYTGPIAFAVIGALLVIWGLSPFSPDTTPPEVRTLRVFALWIGTMAFVPSLFAIAAKFYDRIPGLQSLLEPILHKRRISQPDVVDLDDQFLRGDLHDTDYESRLIALLGIQRGRSHFRYMRNYKHFGLD